MRKFYLNVPDSVLFYIAIADRNHSAWSIDASRRTDVLDDADMIIAVTGDESAEQLLHLGKPIRWVSPDEQFKTPSQIALDESDWKMLRKLEALLPEDDALRMERNALRAAVDDEL